jgi:hypothetical protein
MHNSEDKIQDDKILTGQQVQPSRKMTSSTPMVLFLLGLVFMLCLAGCKNPFKTRKSPPPVAQTEGTWDTPSEPQVVITNLFYAYSEKIITNFDRCLCDSFRFSAPEDSQQAIQDNREELFAGWDRNAELSVTTNIFTTFRHNLDSISYLLLFDPVPPVPDDISDTAAVLLRDYQLLILEVKSASVESTLAKGTATFHMQQTSLNWWCICFWGDIPELSGGYDWGDFKAEFR